MICGVEGKLKVQLMENAWWIVAAFRLYAVLPVGAVDSTEMLSG